MPSPSAIAHEALLEAIDAYLAMARPPQNLARVLEAVRAHLAAPSAVTGSATTPSAGGATGEMAGRRTA